MNWRSFDLLEPRKDVCLVSISLSSHLIVALLSSADMDIYKINH